MGYRQRFFRMLPTGIGLASGISWYSMYIDAPRPDTGDEILEDNKEILPFAHGLARLMTFSFVSLSSNIYLKQLNNFTCDDPNKLGQLLDSRKKGQSIITVSNHTSTVDDPAVLACLVPWKVSLYPNNARWGLCSQEYCFEKGRLVSALCYAGKALPIKRGAGVDQKLLKEFFYKAEAGDWIHIFPEGKIVQSGKLGGRDGPSKDKIGLLKWGVGKIIARATIRPVVVPIYHIGMENIMPQNAENKLKSIIPKTGQHVHVLIGDPISFDDIFAEYDNEHKKTTEWQSKAYEFKLYSRITKRIEDTLIDLEKQAYQELERLKSQKVTPTNRPQKEEEKLGVNK